MYFLKLSVALVLLLVPVLTSATEVVDVYDGASGSFVDVTSATVGVRIGPDAIRTGLRVRVKVGGAVPVCFNYVDRGASCATALTDPDNAGFCLAAGVGDTFRVGNEHFRGQVCAILSSGVTAVRVPYNAW